MILPIKNLEMWEWQVIRGRYKCVLKKEIHTWFSAKGIRHSITTIDGQDYIYFEKESDAMLFKLTWL